MWARLARTTWTRSPAARGIPARRTFFPPTITNPRSIRSFSRVREIPGASSRSALSTRMPASSGGTSRSSCFGSANGEGLGPRRIAARGGPGKSRNFLRSSRYWEGAARFRPCPPRLRSGKREPIQPRPPRRPLRPGLRPRSREPGALPARPARPRRRGGRAHGPRHAPGGGDRARRTAPQVRRQSRGGAAPDGRPGRRLLDRGERGDERAVRGLRALEPSPTPAPLGRPAGPRAREARLPRSAPRAGLAAREVGTGGVVAGALAGGRLVGPSGDLALARRPRLLRGRRGLRPLGGAATPDRGGVDPGGPGRRGESLVPLGPGVARRRVRELRQRRARRKGRAPPGDRLVPRRRDGGRDPRPRRLGLGVDVVPLSTLPRGPPPRDRSAREVASAREGRGALRPGRARRPRRLLRHARPFAGMPNREPGGNRPLRVPPRPRIPVRVDSSGGAGLRPGGRRGRALR